MQICKMSIVFLLKIYQKNAELSIFFCEICLFLIAQLSMAENIFVKDKKAVNDRNGKMNGSYKKRTLFVIFYIRKEK